MRNTTSADLHARNWWEVLQKCVQADPQIGVAVTAVTTCTHSPLLVTLALTGWRQRTAWAGSAIAQAALRMWFSTQQQQDTCGHHCVIHHVEYRDCA